MIGLYSLYYVREKYATQCFFLFNLLYTEAGNFCFHLTHFARSFFFVYSFIKKLRCGWLHFSVPWLPVYPNVERRWLFGSVNILWNGTVAELKAPKEKKKAKQIVYIKIRLKGWNGGMHLGTRSSLYIPRATGVKPNLVLFASCGCGQDGLKRAVSYVSVWMCYGRMLTGGDIKYESEGNDKRCESTMTIVKKKKAVY